MTEEQRLWLWLNYATEHNPRLFYELLQRFDDIEEAYRLVLRHDLDRFEGVSDSVRRWSSPVTRRRRICRRM